MTVLGALTAGLAGCTRQLKANAALFSANAERYRWVTARQKEMQSGFDAIDNRPRRPVGGFNWSKR